MIIRNRFAAAVFCGSIAIFINSFLLYLGGVLGVDTGHGGLLKLLSKIIGIYPIAWGKGYLSGVTSFTGKYWFHIAVGIFMAFFYVYIFDVILGKNMKPILKGLIYALLVWLANSIIVLPALGYGFAGHLKIPASGMVYYAFAHTAFFVLLAVLYGFVHKYGSSLD